MSAARILVVEDDHDVRESLVEILQDEGYAVSVAADGRQALAALRRGSQKPDVILLDLTMPVMSGAEFREEQLKSAEDAAIPVVILTAQPNAKQSAEMLRVPSFLQKPLKIRPLLDVLQRILNRPIPVSGP